MLHPPYRAAFALAVIMICRTAVAADPPQPKTRLHQKVVSMGTLSHTAPIRTLSFSPAGNRLVTVDDKGTLTLWDLLHKKVLFALNGKKGEYGVCGALIAPAGRSVVYCELDRSDCVIKRLNLVTKRAESTGLQTGLVTVPVGFGANGRVLLTAGTHVGNYSGNDVHVWDLAKATSIFSTELGTFCVAITPAGDEIATGYRQGAVVVWNVHSGKEVAIFRQAEAVTCVAYAPKSTLLAAGGDGGTIKIWDREKRKEVSSLKGHGGSLRSLAWSHDSRWLASEYVDGMVTIWNVAAAEERTTFKANPKGEWAVFAGACLEFDNDDKVLATGGAIGTESGDVRLWDTSFLAGTKRPSP